MLGSTPGGGPVDGWFTTILMVIGIALVPSHDVFRAAINGSHAGARRAVTTHAAPLASGCCFGKISWVRLGTHSR